MKVFPSAANSVSIVGNATPWANSAYGQLVAAGSAGADGKILASLIPQWNLLAESEVELDIATGGAGSEVVVTTFRGAIALQQIVNPWILLPLLDNIAGSTRIAARLRKSATDANTHALAIQYYDKTSFGAEVSAQPQKVAPAAANGILLSPTTFGGAYGTCPWAEVIASVAADMVVTGVVVLPLGAHSSARYIIEIGVGTAGNEVKIASISFNQRSNAGWRGEAGPIWLPAPYDGVVAGSRVAMRLIPGPTTSNFGWKAAICYAEKPL